MKNKIPILIIILIAICSTIILYFYEDHKYLHKEDHIKYRIVYYEGGPYYDYRTNLLTLFEGLIEYGIIEPIDFTSLVREKESENSREVWDYVCDNLKSKGIVLHKEDFYSSNWDESIRAQNKKLILEKIKTLDKNSNLILGMGTWAGLDLIKNIKDHPVMILSCTDAVASRVIDKANDPRFPNVFVEYNQHIYYQQIKLFYSIFQFKKLGIVYTDTVDGKSYIAYDDIMSLSKSEDFEVITCEYNENEQNESVLIESGKKCVDELATKCDAMYFGDQSFLKYNYMPYVISATIKNKIPTWSHHGIEHVRRGILMSKSHEHDFKKKGLWQANILNQIIHGKTPYKIDGVWKDKTELVINLEVARDIGFVVPDALLKISKKVFNEIEEMDNM